MVEWLTVAPLNPRHPFIVNIFQRITTSSKHQGPGRSWPEGTTGWRTSARPLHPYATPRRGRWHPPSHRGAPSAEAFGVRVLGEDPSVPWVKKIRAGDVMQVSGWVMRLLARPTAEEVPTKCGSWVNILTWGKSLVTFLPGSSKRSLSQHGGRVEWKGSLRNFVEEVFYSFFERKWTSERWSPTGNPSIH